MVPWPGRPFLLIALQTPSSTEVLSASKSADEGVVAAYIHTDYGVGVRQEWQGYVDVVRDKRFISVRTA